VGAVTGLLLRACEELELLHASVKSSESPTKTAVSILERMTISVRRTLLALFGSVNSQLVNARLS
jgi:hypothetical protein